MVCSNQSFEVFGRLYNWYAVADNRGLCPTGWHVPTEDEVDTLVLFIGDNPAHSLKSSTTWGQWRR